MKITLLRQNTKKYFFFPLPPPFFFFGKDGQCIIGIIPSFLGGKSLINSKARQSFPPPSLIFDPDLNFANFKKASDISKRLHQSHRRWKGGTRHNHMHCCSCATATAMYFSDGHVGFSIILAMTLS